MGDILILDNGAYTAKIGYASSKEPKYVNEIKCICHPNFKSIPGSSPTVS